MTPLITQGPLYFMFSHAAYSSTKKLPQYLSLVGFQLNFQPDNKQTHQTTYQYQNHKQKKTTRPNLSRSQATKPPKFAALTPKKTTKINNPRYLIHQRKSTAKTPRNTDLHKIHKNSNKKPQTSMDLNKISSST